MMNWTGLVSPAVSKQQPLRCEFLDLVLFSMVGAQLEFTMRRRTLSARWLTSRCCVRGGVVINHLIIMLVVEARNTLIIRRLFYYVRCASIMHHFYF